MQIAKGENQRPLTQYTKKWLNIFLIAEDHSFRLWSDDIGGKFGVLIYS